MIRSKEYSLNGHITFEEIQEISKNIEFKYPHLHCRINVHTLEFQVVNKQIETKFPELQVHQMCRKIWDKNYKEKL